MNRFFKHQLAMKSLLFQRIWQLSFFSFLNFCYKSPSRCLESRVIEAGLGFYRPVSMRHAAMASTLLAMAWKKLIWPSPDDLSMRHGLSEDELCAHSAARNFVHILLWIKESSAVDPLVNLWWIQNYRNINGVAWIDRLHWAKGQDSPSSSLPLNDADI